MKIGVSTTISSDSEDVAAMAQKAEEVGFDSFWLPEHAIIPVHTDSRYGGTSDGSIPASMSDMGDPFIGLARASATTSKIMLGTAVCLVPEHNPLVQAKQIAALDFHSGGRFIFGVGTGWLREETEIMGGDFDHRWTQARESIEVMRALWTQDTAEYHGRYYDFPPVQCNPKPAQEGGPPVILGGNARNVFQRVARWGDGWMPTAASPDQIAAGRAAIDELAEASGRDPGSIDITVFGQPADRDIIGRFENAGANRVIVRLGDTTSIQALTEMERIAEAVL
jgi:probable F420-dependent oxidoreductase